MNIINKIKNYNLAKKYLKGFPKTNLPICMQIAARLTEMDNLKVEPINTDVEIRYTAKTLLFFNYEKRIINKCVSFINNDIKTSLEKNKNVKFKPFILCSNFYIKNFIFIQADCKYIIN